MLRGTHEGRIEFIQAGGLELDSRPMGLYEYVLAMRQIGEPGHADGTWTAQQLAQVNALIAQYWKTPTEPDRFVEGDDNNNVLVGGSSDNTLFSGLGDDAYIVESLSGFTHIRDTGGCDRLVINGEVDLEDLFIFAGGDSLYIDNYKNGGYIRLEGWFESSDNQIEYIQIGDKILTHTDVDALIARYETIGWPTGGDGTSWTSAQRTKVRQLISDFWRQGTIPDGKIIGTGDNDILTGSDGDDVIFGLEGDDVIHGGSGNDSMNGGAGNDVYEFGRGDGHDVVNTYDDGLGKRDTLRLLDLARDEVVFIRQGNDDFIVRIRDTGETITIRKGMLGGAHGIQAIVFGDDSVLEWRDVVIDEAYGTNAGDEITGGSSGELLFGLAGDDIIHGKGGNDILDGGAGNDHLVGGAGDDTYVFGRGDGHDTVDSYDPKIGKRDIILLRDLVYDDVELLNNPAGDFIIRIKDTGETITVLGGMKDQAHGIQAIEFADGAVVDWDSIYFQNAWGGEASDTLHGGALADNLFGLAGDDHLYGHEGDDVLEGGSGNDHLDGGAGNDVFVFGRGYGHDTVNAYDSGEGKFDVIRLQGLTRNDVEFLRCQNGDFTIRILDTGETITVIGGTRSEAYAIQAIEFADGIVLPFTDIHLADIWGTTGDDMIAGSSGDDIIHALAGNDTVVGDTGNDTIYGGEGDDVLHGGAGNDVLDGGEGNDSLEGGTGNDIFVFGRGYGHDTVSAYDLEEGKNDTIRLNGLALEDVEFLNTRGNDFIIKIKDTGETMTVVSGMVDHAHGVQEIVFGDGTVLSFDDIQFPNVWGTDGDDVLNGGAVGEFVYGFAGNDMLSGGGGNDILDGGTGNDRLDGGAGDDILDGGAGNDHLDGGAGNDVFVFWRGGGHDIVNAHDTTPGKRDIIRLAGLLPKDVEFVNTRQGDLVITIKDTGETMTVVGGMVDSAHGIQAVQFGDGSVVEWSEIYFTDVWGTEGDDALHGGAGDDTLYGFDGDDFLYGHDGNDILHGGAGNDSLNGGGGNDVYVFGRGDGHDTINSFDPTTGKRDIIRLVGLHPDDVEFVTRNARDFVIRIKDTGETITVLDGFMNRIYGIQAIEFADGSVLEWDDIICNPLTGTNGADHLVGTAESDYILGLDGDDTIMGGVGHDTLIGGAGDDYLEGGSGNDVYVFGRGDGNDIVNSFDPVSGKRDIVRLIGLNQEDVEFTDSGWDFVIRIKDTGETLTVLNGQLGSAYAIQAVEFADGTVWTPPQSSAAIVGTAGNDTLTGTGGTDMLVGLDGDDILNGAGGNDYLDGGNGNDTLNGGDGNDTLWGGAGNDVLNGGNGDDVYMFGRGDGHDVVNEVETRVGRRNVIMLGEGIGVDDIELLVKSVDMYSNDFIVRIKDTGETITVVKGMHNNRLNAAHAASIQAIEFADGTVWEWADIVAQPMHVAEGSFNNAGYVVAEGGVMIGNAADNKITGTAQADTIYGGAGDDTLLGNAGNDTLWGGSGNDRLEGGAGDDVYLFGRGDGHDVVYETEARAGRRNVVRLNEGIGMNDIELLSAGPLKSGYQDLIIRIKDTGETLTINNGLSTNYANTTNANSIQAIEFADGTIWEWSDILSQPIRIPESAGNASTNAARDGSYIAGNSGDNTLTGGAGNDTLHGGAGNDILIGGNGDDVYIFGRGDGHDIVNEVETRAGRRNVVRFGDGIGVDDIEILSSGLSGTYYMDLVVKIKDTGETLTIAKGLSNYYANHTNMIQAFEFADGTVWEWADILSRPLLTPEGQTTTYADIGGSFLLADDLAATLVGAAGNDTLYGGAGDDTLRGANGDDVLWGGAGDDRLEGGNGDDTYLYGRGDGHDTVYEMEGRLTRRNVVRLGEGIGVDDIELINQMNPTAYYMDLIIRIKDTGETLTISRGLSTQYVNTNRATNNQNVNAIQAIEFADGTVWEWEDIIGRPILMADGDVVADMPVEGGHILGNDLNNTINGSAVNDIIQGGGGNDVLNGKAGDDVYVFGYGDGHDTINETETRADRRNVIRLGEGIGVDDIELLLKQVDSSSGDFIVRLKSTGETITVVKGMANGRLNTAQATSIQAIEFADGTVWEWADICEKPMLLADGSYSNYGFAAAEGGVLVGNDAANRLTGSANNDALYGGAGNDTLIGNAGNDILAGGTGVDRLEGGAGDDTYIFNRGDGQDIIVEASGKDGIVFGDGIDWVDLNFTRSGNNLVICVDGTQDTLTIQNWFSNDNYKIEVIEAGGMALMGAQMNDLLQILAAFGAPQGANGAWTGGQKGQLAVVAADFWNSITPIPEDAQPNILHGGVENDVLEGHAGNDIYLFGRGDGHDSVRETGLAANRHNVVRLLDGVGADDIELLVRTVDATHSDLIIRIKDTGETLTIEKGMHNQRGNIEHAKSIQAIEFADGTIWEWSDIIAMPMRVADGSLDNSGYAALEGGVLAGNGANSDKLYGNAGDDAYLFGYGDGNDTIYENETRAGRRNIIRLGEGIGGDDIEFLLKPVDGINSDFIVRLKSTGETITVAKGECSNKLNAANPTSIQAIEFADGTVWEWADICAKPMYLAAGSYANYGYVVNGGGTLIGNDANNVMSGGMYDDTLYGGAGNDTLRGNAGNDILYGGLGTDRLEGGAGNDTFVFNRGDGADTIYDTAGDDTLLFGDDISWLDLGFSRSGNNLVIDVLGSQDKVTINSWYSNNIYKVETIEAGGMELVSTQMDQMLQALASFGTPAGVDGSWTEEQKEALAPMLSSYWRASGT